MKQRILYFALAVVTLALFCRLYFSGSPKAEDVEINVKEETLSPGSLKFEGTIMNTSAKDISEVTVTAGVSDLSFDDDALRGCGLESEIATVRNLKAG